MKSQLQKLRTLLQTSLDIEAKSTPGEWSVMAGGRVIVTQKTCVVLDASIHDALFITNAKRLDAKMARGLLKELNDLEYHLAQDVNSALNSYCNARLQSLLTIFAKELE